MKISEGYHTPRGKVDFRGGLRSGLHLRTVRGQRQYRTTFQHLTLACTFQLSSKVWLKSHLKGRDRPLSTPPTSVLLSRKTARKPVHFLSHTSLLLAEMTAPRTILCLDMEIRSLSQTPLPFPVTFGQSENLWFFILNVSNPLLFTHNSSTGV